MANKKRRLEEDPNASERGKGSKPEKGKPGEDGKINVTVKIGDFNLPKWNVEDLEKAREQAQQAMRSAARGSGLLGGSGMFGGSMHHSEGGNVFIEGSDGRARSFYDDMAKDPAIQDAMRMILDVGGEDEVDFKDAVARMLHTKAIECWDQLMGWQFACTYNEGQATFWFTARYFDDEAGEALVTETLEFSEEVLAKRNWDESHLEVERQMEKMHEKCVADLAMFDD